MLDTIRREIREAGWFNGAVFVMVGFALILVCTNVFRDTAQEIIQEAPPAPLEFARLVVFDSAPVRPGKTLLLLAQPCNNTDEPIEASFAVSWLKETNGVTANFPAGGGVAVIPPGCNPSEVIVRIPPELPPGLWYRAGVVNFVFDGIGHSVAYRSDLIEVVAP